METVVENIIKMQEEVNKDDISLEMYFTEPKPKKRIVVPSTTLHNILEDKSLLERDSTGEVFISMKIINTIT